MDRAPVELRVGGHTFRVVASTGADDLRRLATVVDGKLRELAASSAFHPQSMLLVAISLAHELEQERARRREVEQRSREMLRSLLARVDGALELTEPAVESDVDADSESDVAVDFDDGDEPAPPYP